MVRSAPPPESDGRKIATCNPSSATRAALRPTGEAAARAVGLLGDRLLDRTVAHRQHPGASPEQQGPVADDHDDRLRGQLRQRPVDGPLRLGIQCARRLVEDEQGRFAEQGAGDRHPLALATGQPLVAVTDAGPLPFRELPEVSVERRSVQRVGDRLVARLPVQAHVVRDRRPEEGGVLVQEGDGRGPRRRVVLVHRRPVDEHAPGRGGQEPGHERRQRGLAAAGRTDEADAVPGVHP
jgi:hypothetical protein